MSNPFVRTSCGCIVIMTDRDADAEGRYECICVKACDNDNLDGVAGDWMFGIRKYENHKLIEIRGHNYKSQDKPRPLNAAEVNTVIDAISRIMVMGLYADRIGSAMQGLERMRGTIPTLHI